jgi:multidrug resistance efflux pump
VTERDMRPIETPRAQKIEDFQRRTLPLIVWSVCALIVAAMFVGRARRFEYIGMASALEYEVSSSARATLETVVVDLYDDVEVGDVVAKLDDQPLLASIRTSEATIRQLNAELEAARSQVLADTGQDQAGWTADLRRFQIDEEQRRLEVLGLKVQTEGDRVELARLALELERSKTLLGAGLVSQSEYDIARLSHEQVRRRLEDNVVLLAQTEAEYEQARSRREAFERDLPQLPRDEPLITPLREAIAVENRRLEEIEVLRQSMVLRSPVVGRVSQILCRRGQAVVPGEPILLIAEQSVREVVAYLDEEAGSRIRQDSPVLVSNRNGGGTVAESVVLRVSPGVQVLPQRLWSSPQVPAYGRAVVIAAYPGMNLTPGQLVDVRFLDN